LSDNLILLDFDRLVTGVSSQPFTLLPRFDHIVLLSAPPEILAEQLATRTTSGVACINVGVIEPWPGSWRDRDEPGPG
jgi:hypothetical protein